MVAVLVKLVNKIQCLQVCIMAKRGPKGANRGAIKKGEVRNPRGENGQKREQREIKAIAQEFLNESYAAQVNGGQVSKERLRWLLEKAFAMAMSGSYQHLKELLAQAYGMPTQRTELTGKDGAELVGFAEFVRAAAEPEKK
jgi:hypothetical protein